MIDSNSLAMMGVRLIGRNLSVVRAVFVFNSGLISAIDHSGG